MCKVYLVGNHLHVQKVLETVGDSQGHELIAFRNGMNIESGSKVAAFKGYETRAVRKVREANVTNVQLCNATFISGKWLVLDNNERVI